MATIQLRTKFFPIAFLLLLFPARASVDGAAEQKVGWGTTDLSVSPGSHRIEVWFPYFFVFNVGKASTEVSVQEGQTVQVTYKAPWLVFLPGKIKVG
ncbi:MAG: hypothetical protein JWM71_2399 [Solirubrobacteraceae bacterium]|nr:hypothetical protein [Solirubrobacteraceae bacterium]